MEIIYILLSIIQTVSISLGVGCSTVAIVSFFVAIKDGKIDETERKMLGVVYILLRVAMITILTTTTLLAVLFIVKESFQNYVQTFTISTWILVSVLYGNAILMTKHIMPSTFGPAIQASSWYTLGILLALESLSLTHFSLFQFVVGYTAAIAFTTALVNGIIAHLKHSTNQ